MAQRYVGLIGVQQQNDTLRQENKRLRAELIQREEQRLENQRLRRLFELRQRSSQVEPILARVVAASSTPLFRSIRIDRGESDGVEVGFAVVNQDGVVGRVAALTADWSDVMLVVDANSSTDVLVQRSRARVRIRGRGRDHVFALGLEFLERTADVEPGDLLLTSGIGSIFPKGLVVGRVVSVENRAFGLYNMAIAEPTVDFRRLEEVMILRSGWRQGTDFESSNSAEESPYVQEDAAIIVPQIPSMVDEELSTDVGAQGTRSSLASPPRGVPAAPPTSEYREAPSVIRDVPGVQGGTP
ncbi:MAG: rod shape-determining protein MreC [Myxococcota bacterium]